MPRFHFNSADGSREIDEIGIELPDIAATHAHALAFAGEVLRSEPESIWSKGQWRVEVTDDDGTLPFTVITLAIDAPPREMAARR